MIQLKKTNYEDIHFVAELCYELYKLDWMRKIPTDVCMDTYKDYYTYTTEETRKEISFEDYIEEVGYSGEIYVDCEAFMESQFQNKEYMEKLLDDNKLITAYRKYLKEYI